MLGTWAQACHDLVPPEWLQPVIRHLCNQFVHDRARPEEICVGLKTVREICMRMPLIMNEEMLLVCTLLYKVCGPPPPSPGASHPSVQSPAVQAEDHVLTIREPQFKAEVNSLHEQSLKL